MDIQGKVSRTVSAVSGGACQEMRQRTSNPTTVTSMRWALDVFALGFVTGIRHRWAHVQKRELERASDVCPIHASSRGHNGSWSTRPGCIITVERMSMRTW